MHCFLSRVPGPLGEAGGRAREVSSAVFLFFLAAGHWQLPATPQRSLHGRQLQIKGGVHWSRRGGAQETRGPLIRGGGVGHGSTPRHPDAVQLGGITSYSLI